MTTPHDFFKHIKKDKKAWENNCYQAKILKIMRPLYGFDASWVSELMAVTDPDTPLLETAQSHPNFTGILPPNLFIGGFTAGSITKLLSLNVRQEPIWLAYMKKVGLFSDNKAIWVLDFRGVGPFVIHNDIINEDKREAGIDIPSRRDGMCAVQAVRLENYIKEKIEEVT